MLIVALTGGIATGKSVVARVLEEKGCFVQNADVVAHELMNPGQEIWAALIRHFGQKILNEDQSINRKKLGEIIFKNPQERDFLNELTHPRILKKIKETIAQLEKSGRYEIYITEAPLVIESGYHYIYDRLILTYCQPEIQLSRLCQRDRITPAQALRIIKAQMTNEEKIPYADYLIETSGSLAQTIEQAEQIYFNLFQDSMLKKAGQL
ncbi:MAG: dephospho-CoA kinase [Candidatus Saccharicenans sp.]|nr:MAG: dephospho-CoA kinase [Candidatus Aminicenantes bacterium]HEK85275.1 dephospho-CoA kinase [Candidatus Aminicenantes bacterium]